MIYERMDCMLEKIRDIIRNNKYADEYSQKEKTVLDIWKKMNISMYCLYT